MQNVKKSTDDLKINLYIYVYYSVCFTNKAGQLRSSLFGDV